MEKVYVSGKITGEAPIACGLKFGYASTKLREQGYKVINPYALFKPMTEEGFDYDDLMSMCYRAIDVCDTVYMLDDWHLSSGAKNEHEYALTHSKTVIYQSAEKVKK